VRLAKELVPERSDLFVGNASDVVNLPGKKISRPRTEEIEIKIASWAECLSRLCLKADRNETAESLTSEYWLCG
jgi:hypothetical protein